jgi:probable selenium-dependent hydroxylase accessory protein YqeC
MSGSLRVQLELGERELVAIVGAGGKSTVLFTLASELAADNHRVVLTTTTKMAQDQVTEPACWSANPDDVERTLGPGVPLFVASGTVPGKVTGPSPEEVDRVFEETTVDYVAVEADGARSMSIKAPADHEPAIPSRSTLVVIVVGIDAVGRPVRDVAHRPERIEAITGLPADAVVTVADAAGILLHPEGGFKHIPDTARVAIAITKITPATRQVAASLKTILAANPRVDHVVALPLAAR